VVRKRVVGIWSVDILRGIRHFTQDFQSLTPFSEELHNVYRILTHETQISRSLERVRVWKKREKAYGIYRISSQRNSDRVLRSESDSTRKNYYAHLRMRKNVFLSITHRKICFSEKEIANYKLQ